MLDALNFSKNLGQNYSHAEGVQSYNGGAVSQGALGDLFPATKLSHGCTFAILLTLGHGSIIPNRVHTSILCIYTNSVLYYAYFVLFITKLSIL